MNEIPIVRDNRYEVEQPPIELPQTQDFGWDIAPFSHNTVWDFSKPSYDQAILDTNTNGTRMPWPVQDSTFAQVTGSSSNGDSKPILSSFEQDSSSLIPELSTEASLGLGAGASFVNSALNTSTNNQLELEAREGTGQFGHSFAAGVQTQVQTNYNNNVTNLENVAIGLGSVFGPEGLAAGVAAAGVIGAVSSEFAPSSSVIQGSSGNMVDPTNF